MINDSARTQTQVFDATAQAGPNQDFTILTLKQLWKDKNDFWVSSMKNFPHYLVL